MKTLLVLILVGFVAWVIAMAVRSTVAHIADTDMIPADKLAQLFRGTKP